MHSYTMGSSQREKDSNWSQVQRIAIKKGWALPEELVTACAAGHFGASTALLEMLYEHFTQKKYVQKQCCLNLCNTSSFICLAFVAHQNTDLLEFRIQARCIDIALFCLGPSFTSFLFGALISSGIIRDRLLPYLSS